MWIDLSTFCCEQCACCKDCGEVDESGGRGQDARSHTGSHLFTHYSQLFTHYSHTIHTLFATIRALFAHYSHTIRAGSHRFTSVRAGSRRFTHVQAWFAPVSDSVRTICAIRRYSHYSRGIRTRNPIRTVYTVFAGKRYSRSIRAVFAQYSHTFPHIRTCSHLGRTLFATIHAESHR